jgi:hypothetical protein
LKVGCSTTQQQPATSRPGGDLTDLTTSPLSQLAI